MAEALSGIQKSKDIKVKNHETCQLRANHLARLEREYKYRDRRSMDLRYKGNNPMR